MAEVPQSASFSSLNETVSQEIVIVTLVILIGGFLAYVPTPPSPQSSVFALTGR